MVRPSVVADVLFAEDERQIRIHSKSNICFSSEQKSLLTLRILSFSSEACPA